jgi:hypothetical protein
MQTIFNENKLYQIIPLEVLRRTQKVYFDNVPIIQGLSAIDRVIHEPYAFSPGSIEEVVRPWYMHPHQDDNLLVLFGTRIVELYTKEHGKVETFEITPEEIRMNGTVIFEGAALFGWPPYVFHRVESKDKGSASLNFARHFEGFDIQTNFNIYDLDINTGEYKVIRNGHLDQPSSIKISSIVFS